MACVPAAAAVCIILILAIESVANMLPPVNLIEIVPVATRPEWVKVQDPLVLLAMLYAPSVTAVVVIPGVPSCVMVTDPPVDKAVAVLKYTLALLFLAPDATGNNPPVAVAVVGSPVVPKKRLKEPLVNLIPPAVYVNVPGKAAEVPSVRAFELISRSPDVIVNTPLAPVGERERLTNAAGMVSTLPEPTLMVRLAGPLVAGNSTAVIAYDAVVS